MTDVAIAAAGAAWEPQALAAVDQAPHLRLARRCVDVSELLAVVRTGAASVALVDPALPGLDIDVVRELTSAGAAVAACGDTAAAAALGIARRPDPTQLGQVDWAEPVPVPGPPPPPSTGADDRSAGRVLVVWGPAGAPGRSTLALALASALAGLGQRPALVDADVAGGTLAQQLGVLDDLSGILASCRAAGNGRVHEVDGHLVEVEPGLDLLTGIPRADLWPHLRVGALGTVLDRLRSDHAHVVVDVGSGLDLDGTVGRSRHALTRHLVEEADDLVVVGRADPVGLSRLVRGLAELREVVPGPPSAVVVNLAGTGPGWSEREVAETVRRLAGRAPDLFLPADPATLHAAMMHGRSPGAAAPASPFVGQVRELVATLRLDDR
ncbi:MAG: hypothetical protein P1U38_02730 [Aeromicrobium sp.]|uniref:AAA family ATPase n=1 Tax=Aeromicrobium sp. TaxID=1871063 RepID=UPI002625EE4B|nr:hypothetical protein [Aeromicrobium sp.]MDF1703667.1 hypothetical protein [Aeromicrobium sp.]